MSVPEFEQDGCIHAVRLVCPSSTVALTVCTGQLSPCYDKEGLDILSRRCSTVMSHRQFGERRCHSEARVVTPYRSAIPISRTFTAAGLSELALSGTTKVRLEDSDMIRPPEPGRPCQTFQVSNHHHCLQLDACSCCRATRRVRHLAVETLFTAKITHHDQCMCLVFWLGSV